MSSEPKVNGKVVIVQIRISPKQAERLEKIYRIFGVPKSAVTEIALEEYCSRSQTFNMNKFRSKR